MRGLDGMQEALFMLAKLKDFVPAEHPLRSIRRLVNEALGRLNGLFNLSYADTGRASIAPEKLLRAMLIQVFFSVRSERQLMEQVRFNLLCGRGSQRPGVRSSISPLAEHPGISVTYVNQPIATEAVWCEGIR